MIDASGIKAEMLVTTAQAEQVAMIDHLVSDRPLGQRWTTWSAMDHLVCDDLIKLKKNESGTHHFIPVSWVISTEGGVVKTNRTI